MKDKAQREISRGISVHNASVTPWKGERKRGGLEEKVFGLQTQALTEADKEHPGGVNY